MFKKVIGVEPADRKAPLIVEPMAEGLRYALQGVATSAWLATPFACGDAASLGARLALLFQDGYGDQREDHFLLPWADVHAIAADPNHADAVRLLQFPPLIDHRPVLASQGSIGDASFSVHITHWVDGRGVPLRATPNVRGAVAEVDGAPGLLQQSVWSLLQQLQEFHAVPQSERTIAFKERAWARVRRWAKASNAPLSDYLEKTIVVTPDKLKLGVGSATVGADRVVEVTPDFEGAPAGWLALFDRMPLQNSYSVPDGMSLTKVVLSEPVKRVLAEIKAMPGRRVAGARAQAFIRNPRALLGDDATGVIDEEQVEKALLDAGVAMQRFAPHIRRGEQGQVSDVYLRIETYDGQDGETEEALFADAEHLRRFCERLGSNIDAGLQCCAWEGNDLEIVGDTPEHLSQLRAWLAEWRHAAVWSASELFDLSHYSDRVSEIGVEKAYVVPVVAKRSVELDWFVDNVLFGLAVRPPGSRDTTLVTLTAEDVPAALTAIELAKTEGAGEVQLPNAPFPVALAEAEAALRTIEHARQGMERQEFDPTKPKSEARPEIERKQLIIKSNIDIVDHAEARAQLFALPPDTQPDLPSSLHPDTDLKPHQRAGVAWLQRLWRLSPNSCRGALLADDMGLGKTLQLLTFIAHCLERDPRLDPVLVVAPLTLLENWRAEVEKFFVPGALPLLTLYGSSLAGLRLGKHELDPELEKSGITRLLRKGWLGTARIVLTTYETMRDLEFALAAQSWSIMVCDEAQKIKNPGAMVTRTAKKQKVRFRIACTGTPVENTLMDMWCLFDFIQPGLLGALNQFGRTYRQPIEAKTDQQKARVQELRNLIEPQTMRRTKMEVAKDILPQKLEDASCRELKMSDKQLRLYWSALEQLKRQKQTDPSAQLQTLHHIRRICSDPHWQDAVAALRLPLQRLLDESPKMRWLVERLEHLRDASARGAGEKVIVFCEFRDLQTLLQRVVNERFGLNAFVVNGDTSASMEVENSRQKLIDRFQAAPGFNVIILSPLAVGFGVNIQAANHVIHFTRTWNPAKEDQATDRAYRIGQRRDVTVYYPSVVGDKFKSFDTILHGLLDWKRGIAQDMLNASGELSVADFGELAT
jgi:hypothetical protein